ERYANSMGQRGQSAAAASGALVGRAPNSRPARGSRPGLRVPETVMLVIVGALQSVLADSAITTRVRDQSAVLQQWKDSPKGGQCPPGTHLSEHTGVCNNCTPGGDYTSYWNDEPICFSCKFCKSDEDERSPCTTTRNRECQCKPGTYRGEDSPEFCWKCRTRCPDGMVEDSPCTPWSDLVCVPKGSGDGLLMTLMVVGVFVVGVFVVVVVVVACLYWRCILTGCDQDPKWVDRVFSWCQRSPRGPGAEDNARNEILNNTDSQSSLVPEQEMESQELAELAGVTVTSPGEAECLL
ncbi:tumor necrosis factor receptor superfamily member 10A, partial [Daubentonia madagascariensis]